MLKIKCDNIAISTFIKINALTGRISQFFLNLIFLQIKCKYINTSRCITRNQNYGSPED